MPYIPQKDRLNFIMPLDRTVTMICAESDDLVRAEYLGYFLQSFTASLLGFSFDEDYSLFVLLDSDKKEIIKNNIKTIVERIYNSNSDLFKQAGELNYCMSAVIWGVLGDSLHSKYPSRYGFRAFVKAFLWDLYHKINSWHWSNVQTSSKRQVLLFQGVITDVIDEMYRRKTSIYEDQKVEEHGDIWPLKDFECIESVPIGRIEQEEEFLL